MSIDYQIIKFGMGIVLLFLVGGSIANRRDKTARAVFDTLIAGFTMGLLWIWWFEWMC